MKANIKNVISILFIVVVIVVVHFVVHSLSDYVSIGNESYSKKSTYLTLDADEKNFTVEKLNKFTKLEHLTIKHINDEMLNDFGEFDDLKELYIYYSELSESLSKLDSYKKLGVIVFNRSTVDLKNFRSSAVEYMFFDDSELKNISALKECSSLLSMDFDSTAVDDYIVPIKKDENETRYVLKDSSVFEGFNNIVILDFENIEIEDISGMLKMENLKFVKVQEDKIPGEFITQLKEKGIEVELL